MVINEKPKENYQKKLHASLAQERELIGNPNLLLVGVYITNYCSFEDILTKYHFTKAELVKLFTRLDQQRINQKC